MPIFYSFTARFQEQPAFLQYEREPIRMIDSLSMFVRKLRGIDISIARTFCGCILCLAYSCFLLSFFDVSFSFPWFFSLSGFLLLKLHKPHSAFLSFSWRNTISVFTPRLELGLPGLRSSDTYPGPENFVLRIWDEMFWRVDGRLNTYISTKMSTDGMWALRSPPTTRVLAVDRLSNRQRLWQRCREL